MSGDIIDPHIVRSILALTGALFIVFGLWFWIMVEAELRKKK